MCAAGEKNGKEQLDCGRIKSMGRKGVGGETYVVLQIPVRERISDRFVPRNRSRAYIRSRVRRAMLVRPG